MKGIAHFIGGLAAASFFPAAIRAAHDGDPWLMLMGGAFGLLPDTLDFKFARYFCRHDMEIAPDPLRPDAKMVADALAGAVQATHEYWRPVCVKLHTVRLSAQTWLQYRVRVRRKTRRIEVVFSEIVDSGGNIVGRLPSEIAAFSALSSDLFMDYGNSLSIGFLEGPTLRFCSHGDCVSATFIHWHREWSHGFLMSLTCGLACWLLFGGAAGAIAAVAVMQHVLADQLGFMGGNLLYPFERTRRNGARISKSDDPRWNFAAVWCSGACVLWNLGLHDYLQAGLLHYLFWGCLVPVAAASILLRRPRQIAKTGRNRR